MSTPHYVIAWKSRAMSGYAFWYYGPNEAPVMEAHRDALVKRGCVVKVSARLDPEAYCLAFDDGKVAGHVQRLEDGMFGGKQ